MTQQTPGFFAFDAFRVDGVRRVLWRADEPVPLAPKVFDTLLVLVENSGRVLDKDELMDAVWPDTAVEENNLTQNVSAIRKALGERRGEHRYVVTVPGRGYRFVADVTQLQRPRGNGAAAAPTPAASADGGGAGGRGFGEETGKFEGSPGTTYARPAVTQTGFLRRRRRLVIASLACAALSAVLAAAWPRLLRAWGDAGPASGADGAALRTLAVLPFKSLGEGADGEHVGSGMADALITRLSNNRQLAVLPTSAVLRYVGQDYDALSVGRRLNAESVVEGKIQRAGERVRVTVQLIRVRDGVPVWAGTFDEKLTDIFAVQDSISERVLEALKITLSREERYQMQRRYTQNPDAAQANIKAHYFMNKGGREGLQKGLEYFRRAVELDPNYALGYAGMGDCYTRLNVQLGVPLEESTQKAREVLVRAVEIDPSVAYAHSILGRIAFNYDWDFEEAGRAYRRARELDPAIAHQWFAFYLLLMDRTAEADLEIQRFADAQPLLPNNGHTQYFFLKREYDRAAERVAKTLEIDPGNAAAREWRGLIYEQKGMRTEAAAEFRKAMEMSGGSAGHAMLGRLYAVTGRRAEAREVLRRLTLRSKETYVPPFSLALIHAALGENEEAVRQLERARAAGFLPPAVLRFDPRLDGLRAEPAFRSLAQRLKLPQ